MSLSYVHYDLYDGYVHNWLAGGPQAIPLHDLGRFAGEDTQQAVAAHFYEEHTGINKTPVERGPLTDGAFKVGDYRGDWSYLRCREDHFVDHTTAHPGPHYLRSWAYAQIESETASEVRLVLTTYGPADVWLNGQHVYRQAHFSRQRPTSVPLEVTLREGANPLLVRFETVALRASPHALALRVCTSENEAAAAAEMFRSPKPVSGVRVRLPSTIEDIPRRNELEQAFAEAYLDRYVFDQADPVFVQWPQETKVSAITTVRFQTPAGRIYAESRDRGAPGDRASLGFSFQAPEGPYRVLLMPGPREYYEGNRRITRELPLWCTGNNPFSEAPHASFEERKLEALITASRQENHLFAEIARMALGRWDAVEPEGVMQSIERVNQRQEASILELVGLLGMRHRFGSHPDFPQSLLQPIEDCILDFEYGHDESGAEAASCEAEDQRILSHTAEILAGQLFPDRTFGSGEPGRWRLRRGEQLALAWLHARGATGFADWDSLDSFANDWVALSHLVSLAENESVWEMASVIMDKLFFGLALNSFRGVFASTHRRADALSVMAGGCQATSGISRLMWGMGAFNHHIAAPVSLACMEGYELPPILGDIAAAQPEELWNRERHLVVNTPSIPAGEVNKVTYRTPDYMLSSAQDYRPGERGHQEHIWQAALSPSAVVFVNHPANASDEAAHSPNFWVGNASLPRVAQWKDFLIAIHNLAEDDWMGFTHAHFPLYAFDDYLLHDGWAFARKNDGYLALTASRGFSLIEGGHSAYRELRSHGQHNVWLCQMGRAALDGDFAVFQQKVLKLKVVFGGLSVHCDTLRGETLSFGWEEPFLRNGQVQPLTGFMHYENPYCVADLPCSQMEVQWDEYLLRLNFEQPEPDQ